MVISSQTLENLGLWFEHILFDVCLKQNMLSKFLYFFASFSFFWRSKNNLLFFFKKEEKYLVTRQFLKKKLCITSLYDQIHFWGSQWWKNWIIKQILPSWKNFLEFINDFFFIDRWKRVIPNMPVKKIKSSYGNSCTYL